MDTFTNLLYACRTGDLETVAILLDTPNLNVNKTDEWDYSPLILASICGHYEVVELLLQRGAICDRDSFEGERCIYGALNYKIRDLLLSYDFSKKVDINQPFASHITGIFTNNKFINKDLVIRCADKTYFVNRFLLAARSPKMMYQLNNEWHDQSETQSDYDSKSFDILLDYIYLRTDRLTLERIKGAADIAQYFELTDLEAAVSRVVDTWDEKSKSKAIHDNSFMLIEKSRVDMSNFLEKVIDSRVSVPLEFDEDVDYEDIEPLNYLTNNLKSQLFISDCIPDIILSIVDISSESIVYYPCHKSMLIRSEYFETMFNSEIFAGQNKVPIKEYDGFDILDRTIFKASELPVISVTCTDSRVAELVLSYLYHDNVDYIPLSLTVDLLYLSDELLVERLKSLCAVNITSKFKDFSFGEMTELKETTGYDVFELVRISWATRCDKLEHFTSKLIATNLETIFHNPELSSKLHDLIEESAGRIEHRQATDTIELVDDIRYYLSKKYGVSTALLEDFVPIGPSFTGVFAEDTKLRKDSLLMYSRDLEMIDTMLETLDLDA
ncbi:hypothetical protein PSN45_003852 [Yamadazyma tenuis]|uniref:BTB domain-containing protein n=1 Tax=Candida tenuis (strain ATCC 10573 / BCRC 21748 / CBS 615 / JCM 9827 / NBRC 10315 / NRRL Y-1498 / VKM Y-70) TaxID=590646 RepID=G3B314_CANTC|nr:uncharacterized protein CANTEDRAFT_104615 [Yamadazyma tenuis ATCC 10573]EGV64055.1 hypothetical protein CANTEDRAFT_104615 [Yamadazyma tenuis ATCC 10573]WEJ96315.1 hypothetical protein PSN45_003852 [Yamadazyma tenuis]